MDAQGSLDLRPVLVWRVPDLRLAQEVAAGCLLALRQGQGRARTLLAQVEATRASAEALLGAQLAQALLAERGQAAGRPDAQTLGAGERGRPT